MPRIAVQFDCRERQMARSPVEFVDLPGPFGRPLRVYDLLHPGGDSAGFLLGDLIEAIRMVLDEGNG